jgi:hypothetical protein
MENAWDAVIICTIAQAVQVEVKLALIAENMGTHPPDALNF